MKLSLAALLLTLATAWKAAAEVMSLTTATFEPVTTAATGQRTGVWVVNFCASRYKQCKELQPAWSAVAEGLLEHETYLAQVDVETNPSLVKRFKIERMPTVLMFRGGKMYSVPVAGSSEGLAERMRHFITEGYQSAPALLVPAAPLGPWDVFREMREYMGLGGLLVGAASVVGMAAVFVLAVYKQQKPSQEAQLRPGWQKFE